MKARLAPATGAPLMDAYLNVMASVMRFGMDWMGSVMRFGMNTLPAALLPSPNVSIRASASSDQQEPSTQWFDVEGAAPLLNMSGIRIYTNFYFGDITGGATAGGSFDTERQPGSVAEHDRGRADRELTEN